MYNCKIMKILKKEKTGNRFKFEVEADFESYKKAREEILESYSKEMKIPGFRPGKAPRDIVEKNLDQGFITNKATQRLIAELYPKLVHETKIDPVDYPNVDILTFEEGKPIVFSIEVEVYPDITLGKYKGLKVTKKPTEVTDDDVLKVLGDLQNRFAKHINIQDGAVLKDDLVDLEIQAEAEGAQIKRWPRTLQHLPVGMSYISPEFDENLIGMHSNEEKSFAIDFPANHPIPEIAGKKVSFKIKINKIHRKELLPLDDEFAKMLSNVGTLGELKEEIKKNLELKKKEESEADLKNQLIDAVSKDSKIDLPQALVDMETDLMVEELKTSLAQSNLTLDGYLKSLKKTEEEMRKELKTPASSRAKGKVVLRKIGEAEKITVAPHDLDTEVALMAANMGKSTEEYKKSMGEGGISYVNEYLLRRKALDFLVSQAQIEGGK